MPTKIDDIVVVNITKESAKLIRAGFGVPNISGVHTRFPELFRLYGDIDEVAEDFQSGDQELAAATTLFSQDISPTTLMISKRAANVAEAITVTVDTATDDTTYTLTIRGVTVEFVSGTSTTPTLISAGIVSAASGLLDVTIVDTTGSYTVVADTAGIALGASVDVLQSIVTDTANVGVQSELSALIDVSGGNAWYALILTKEGLQADQIVDIKEGAEWIEARTKVFHASIDEADILTTATDDLASFLQSKNYDRTLLFYSTDLASFPEAAILGRRLPNDPGSINWKFTQVSGITPEDLNSTELNNIKLKNANLIEDVGGVIITSTDMVMASGEFMDIIRGIDALEARISEDVFALLVREDKVPFTTSGISQVGGVVQGDLVTFSESPINFIVKESIVVTLPDITTIPIAEREARALNGITFSATLTGAINSVIINGKLSV